MPENIKNKAAMAATNPVWITDKHGLQKAADSWMRTQWLALDTEFIRERTYYAKLGLVQISDAETVWLLDVPALTDHLRPIQAMLQAEHVNKIIHSCSEDLEVISQAYAVLPAAVYDSQIAAAMLGWPLQMRYENLVADVLGIELPSGPSRSNWLQRPLSDAQVQYASNDVAWLPIVMQHLHARLQQLRRWHWLQQDMQALLEKSVRVVDENQLYRRVKGHGRLDAQQLLRLQQLAAWRDAEARRLNLPRSFVLRDEAMLALAMCADNTSGASAATLAGRLARTNTLPPRTLQRYLPSWEKLFSVVPENKPEVEAPLSSEEKTTLAAMQDIIKAEAKVLDVDPALLASRRMLTELLLQQRRSSTSTASLSSWRNEQLQAKLNQLLRANPDVS